MSSAKHLKVSLTVYRSAQAVLFILFKACFRFKAFGANGVPNDSRGVILAPNHASYLDPPMFGVALRNPVTYLAKDYLYKPIVFGSILKWLGTLPIKSGTGNDFNTVRDLLRVLKDGKRIVVFPEGTRTADGQLQKPEMGVGFLAMKSKAWVVPVYIRGSYDAFSRHMKFFRCHPISMHFGKPFIPAEDPKFKDQPEPYMAVAERIMAEIRKIKEDVEKI